MKTILALWTIGLAGLTWLPAYADPIVQTIDLGTVYTGHAPDGSAPWLQAQFAYAPDASGKFTTGTLTLKSLFDAGYPDSVQGGDAATVGWAFFLDPQAMIKSSCSGSGDCASEAVFGDTYGANTGPVPGVFNLSFRWDPDSRFQAGDTAIYDITFGNALTSSPFTKNGSGWLSAAHIEGIGSGSCSGWIVAGTGTPEGGNSCGSTPTAHVPEPPVLGLFGLGLIGLAFSVRRVASVKA